jgi:CRP-like cAMP-binding protein
VIKEIKAGGYFGEEALLEDEPVKYSVELSSVI